MSTSTTAPAPVPDPLELLRIDHAARLLDASVRYVYVEIQAGRLPCVRIGRKGTRGKIRIRRRDLQAYIDQLEGGEYRPDPRQSAVTREAWRTHPLLKKIRVRAEKRRAKLSA